jgi:hypothetical protein
MEEAMTTASCSKFWIIGGEYADVSFACLIDGTQSLAGPFVSYDRALCEWRRLAEATRSNAHHRYVIAHEPPPRGQAAAARPVAMAY